MENPIRFLPVQRSPRRRAACQSCYQSKVKCSRGQPCLRCQVNQRECYYELASRIGKPRGSKNRTSLRSPPPGRGGETATAEAAKKALNNTAEQHSIAPCANMVDVEAQERANGQQHQIPLPTSAEQSWTYSPTDLNTSNLFPSFMSADSPSQNVNPSIIFFHMNHEVDEISQSMTGSSFSLLSHPSSTNLSSPDSFLSRLSSLPEDNQYTSSHSSQKNSLSPSEPHAVSPPAHFYPLSDDAKPNLWGSTISPPPCACLTTLSDSLIRLSPPCASSIPSTLDGFLTGTSTLLAACSNFLTCPFCPKNSLGLCLATTAFATFIQLFTSLKKPLATTPSSNTSHTTLALGTYHIPASDSSAVHALMLQLTVQRWRGACTAIRNLLRELGAKAEKRKDDALRRNGDGAEVDGERDLWAGRDIEFFRQLVQTVDRELAAFCKKGEERGGGNFV